MTTVCPAVVSAAMQFTERNDHMVLQQIEDDKYLLTINGKSATYSKAQIEALSASGYFEGKGGDDTFEMDVYDKDLKLTLAGNGGEDTFIFKDEGAQIAHHQNNAPPNGCTPGTQGETPPAGGGTPRPGTSGTPSSTPVTTQPTASGGTPAKVVDLAAWIASPNGVGFEQKGVGTWTNSSNGYSVTLTQPGGAGKPAYMTIEVETGDNKGTKLTTEWQPDGKGKFVSFDNPNWTADQNKAMSDLMKKGQIEGLDNAFSSVKKKKGGGSATTGGGAAEASSGSTEGSGSVSGGSGLDGTSGLDTSGSDGSDSWFMVLAVAMGTIMNKMADKMIGLLNDIKAAGDDPPYKLTAEFQATAQMLSFMQQAFMAALNALGESIKTGVTAGGAAR